MWRDIWFLATRTLLMTFRKRSTLILYFGLPIAGIVATFLLYGSVGTTELRGRRRQRGQRSTDRGGHGRIR
ncbi:hypothetical protein VQ056_05565 [Paenibacillus sp. JTLBN-2024]